ncbi:Di-trans-poly-cis-decaprenylcistransferase [Rickenella mellea]|uniref:Alkyl transferase n=1 Tax=Rickenella mellea TaxID=50990 RepID=A0A4Y7QDE1_9AGAM|nr:Di-trans-poly-cis-decaprenylcistransferase [Rickenella mellea]
MDGNRRYARKRHLNVTQGHTDGYGALRKLLEVCLQLHIKCVTVYAFSIENFKRSEEEVRALMTLAKEKLLELCENGDLLEEYGVKLNVLGKTALLPHDVQEAVRKAEVMTQNHNRAILNLCMPYTSRDEIVTAIESTINKTLENGTNLDDITEDSIDAEMMTTARGSPPLDILVRTSGVRRLSDFMLWQCCENTQIHFTPTYWPDFGMREFIPVILEYQVKVWNRRKHVTKKAT